MWLGVWVRGAVFVRECCWLQFPHTLSPGLGGGKGAPKHIAVVQLGPHTSGVAVVDAVLAKAGKVVDQDPTTEWGRPVTAFFPSEKQAMTFTVLEADTSEAVARAVSVARLADVVVLVMNPLGGAAGDVDSSVGVGGREFLTALKAAGTPAVVGISQGVLAQPNRKKQAEARKWAAAVFAEQFPGKHCKVADADSPTAVLRALGTVKAKPVAWLAHRPYMVAQHMLFTPSGSVPTPAPAAPTTSPTAVVAAAVSPLGVPDPDAVEAFGAAYATMPSTMEVGTLEISGYLRGCPLHVDGLVHVSGVGTFPLSQVVAPHDPLATGKGGAPPRVVATAVPEEVEDQHTLAEEDFAAGEQTWPTAEEEAAAASAARMAALTKVAGTDTQAVWLEAAGEGDDALAAAGGAAALMEEEEDEDDMGTVADTVAPTKEQLRADAVAAER